MQFQWKKSTLKCVTGRSYISYVFFDKIGGCVLQDCIFIKTQVHQIFFSQNILSKTVSFWHIFQKESAVSCPVKWQSEHCWLVTLLNVTQLSPSIIFHNLFVCVEQEISSFVLNRKTTWKITWKPGSKPQESNKSFSFFAMSAT